MEFIKRARDIDKKDVELIYAKPPSKTLPAGSQMPYGH